jgi:hypothetical protein
MPDLQRQAISEFVFGNEKHRAIAYIMSTPTVKLVPNPLAKAIADVFRLSLSRSAIH